MLLKIRILLMCWFLIQTHFAAKLCVRRYVNGKWITKGDCGGRERMSALQKELKIRAADETIKNRIANGKWVVFQRREHGNVDFFRGWDDYVKGFGNRDGDFWLGLEALHQMTKSGNMELKIRMITKYGVCWVAKYGNFRIGPGSDYYRLHASGFSGNATLDFFSYQNNQQFSTKDADHDGNPALNCASDWEGAWWFGRLLWLNLNGNFHKEGDTGFLMYWSGIGRGGFRYLRFSEMKIRKIS